MAVAIQSAHRPGAEEIVRRRRLPDGRCASPGCEEGAAEGKRFCGPHQERLDRIRAELEGAQSSGENARRWRKRTTKGMKGQAWKEDRDG